MIRSKGYENLENDHQREYALIFWQSLLPNSFRKCMEYSLDNSHVDTGAWRVRSVKILRTFFLPFSMLKTYQPQPRTLQRFFLTLKKGHKPETFVCFWHFLIFIYRILPHRLFNPVLTISISFDFHWSTRGTLSNGVICSHPDLIRHKFSKAGNVSGDLVRRDKQHLRPRFSQTSSQGPSMPASSLHTALPPNRQRTIFPMNLQKVVDHTDLSWYHGIKDIKHITDWSWLSHIIAHVQIVKTSRVLA